MTFDSEIPEVLFTEIKDFIESSSDFDRQSFINSALTEFLLQNGCQVTHLKESYSKYLLNHSPRR